MSEDQCVCHITEIENLQKLKKSMHFEELVHVVVEVIRRNFRGCDMILTLFITALNSCRSDRCLRPFPPSFIRGDVKDTSALINLCDNIPSLDKFVAQPLTYSKELLEFFSWLFIEKGFPLLELVPFNQNIFPSTIPDSVKPHYIFNVHYHSKTNEIFQTRKGDKDIILAYHGSRVDNFYSILKVGLQQHFSIERETLFGKGIYLSSDWSVSGHYSPYGQTWKNSSLGTHHSVVAVCEIINDVNEVKCKDSKNKNRSINENSSGEIPDKYFVVTNSDMVRLKYLLVYRKKLPTVKSFFRQNLLWVILGLYFLMLIVIGCNGVPLKKYFKDFMNVI